MADELNTRPVKYYYRVVCSGRMSDGSPCPSNKEGPHEHDAEYASLVGVVSDGVWVLDHMVNLYPLSV